MFRDYILPNLAVCIIKALNSTYKIIFENPEVVEKVKNQGKRIIFVFWHGRQFVLVNTYKNAGFCIMTSLSKDGDLQAKILTKFGYCIVRGSSSRGGSKALVEMIRAMKKGHDIAFAADGPRGPVYEVKPGPVFLAQKTEAVIIPVAVSAKDKWILNNWDKYLIPKPFTKAYIKYGDPIFVDKDDDVDIATKNLTNVLNQITKEQEGRIN